MKKLWKIGTYLADTYHPTIVDVICSGTRGLLQRQQLHLRCRLHSLSGRYVQSASCKKGGQEKKKCLEQQHEVKILCQFHHIMTWREVAIRWSDEYLYNSKQFQLSLVWTCDLCDVNWSNVQKGLRSRFRIQRESEAHFFWTEANVSNSTKG